MSGTPAPKVSVANALKIYLFPSIVSILAMMIWRDVTELRSDVKQLLAQSNVDKTEIQNLKRDIQMLNHQVFKTPMAYSIPFDKKEPALPQSIMYSQVYIKDEENFDVKKYIPKI